MYDCVYTPSIADANSHTSGETFDRYEVGDLSTKYGDLTELSALSFSVNRAAMNIVYLSTCNSH